MQVDAFMLLYLLLRGVYRALYVVNWIERDRTEKWYKIDYSALVAAGERMDDEIPPKFVDHWTHLL